MPVGYLMSIPGGLIAGVALTTIAWFIRPKKRSPADKPRERSGVTYTTIIDTVVLLQ